MQNPEMAGKNRERTRNKNMEASEVIIIPMILLTIYNMYNNVHIPLLAL